MPVLPLLSPKKAGVETKRSTCPRANARPTREPQPTTKTNNATCTTNRQPGAQEKNEAGRANPLQVAGKPSQRLVQPAKQTREREKSRGNDSLSALPRHPFSSSSSFFDPVAALQHRKYCQQRRHKQQKTAQNEKKKDKMEMMKGKMVQRITREKLLKS